MTDGDGRVRLAGVELRDRDINGIGMWAAGIVINLHPVFVGQATGEEWFHSGSRSAPGAAVVTGLLKNDVTAIRGTRLNPSNVGVSIQVVTYRRITFTETTHEGVHAVSCPLLAAITRAIEALDIGAVVVVSAGQELLTVFRVGRDRCFVCRPTTFRSLLVF